MAGRSLAYDARSSEVAEEADGIRSGWASVSLWGSRRRAGDVEWVEGWREGIEQRWAGGATQGALSGKAVGRRSEEVLSARLGLEWRRPGRSDRACGELLGAGGRRY
ncbi:uncharacterized protein A4U43_C01F13370 [Asparagus officinalis]|uniref:Uncharacterized protein n=1 Tax=Asparagus officinalis TaxID=4686 RepID=A0A5P1FPA0_ASPOF|nr:uncharacterized protein A4U43_C01F13370 [Asparagus officinalis]